VDVGPLRDVITVLIGVATGLLSGLFGVGGGVISQPAMRALGLAPLMVIGTALPVIIPGAASGSIRYSRERLIVWTAVAATVPVGVVMAVVGSLLAEHVPGNGHLLQLATAALLALSAWRMARAPLQIDPEEPLAESDAPEAPAGEPHGQSTTARYAGIGVVAGLLSGLLGIGGGVIMVPAFTQVARVPVKAAIATSLVCVGLFAIPGTITHSIEGHVDWRVATCLIIGAIPGAQVGARLTIRAADMRVRRTVGLFLGFTAVLYFLEELMALLG
jgi:uncharacterized membrane protein YfcA